MNTETPDVVYDFHDPVIMGKAMKLIKNAHSIYYIDSDRMIRIRYGGRWIPYVEAMKIYPKEFTIV